MTVHMFRVLIGRGQMSISDLETRINDWVVSNPEWDADLVNHSLTERNTKLDGTGATYHGVDVRFEQSDTKDNLLQKLTDKIVNKTAWYRVGYHACDHDEDGPLPCGWDDSAEWTNSGVTIPPGVPEMQP